MYYQNFSGGYIGKRIQWYHKICFEIFSYQEMPMNHPPAEDRLPGSSYRNRYPFVLPSKILAVYGMLLWVFTLLLLYSYSPGRYMSHGCHCLMAKPFLYWFFYHSEYFCKLLWPPFRRFPIVSRPYFLIITGTLFVVFIIIVGNLCIVAVSGMFVHKPSVWCRVRHRRIGLNLSSEPLYFGALHIFEYKRFICASFFLKQ